MTSLKRRMMYLCDLSYNKAKTADSSQNSWSVRDKAIGITGTLQRVERNFDIHANTGTMYPRDVAIIGRTTDAIIIAFRGTQPPKPGASTEEKRGILKDWINNANVIGSDDGDQFGGIVHNGISDAAVDLLGGPDGVLARVAALQTVGGAPSNIILTGHSKGGALAVLSAYWMQRHGGFAGQNLSVFTYATPRSGDAAFAADFASRGISVARFETATDIIPLLPAGTDMPAVVEDVARLLGYRPPAGAARFVPIGTRTPTRKPSALQWATAYGPAILQFPTNPAALIDKLVWSHSIAAGGAYEAIVPAT